MINDNIIRISQDDIINTSNDSVVHYNPRYDSIGKNINNILKKLNSYCGKNPSGILHMLSNSSINTRINNLTANINSDHILATQEFLSLLGSVSNIINITVSCTKVITIACHR